ncbi:MAG: biopolymer transporter ExbB [Aestuariivita sp.]|nr:biopolymer transporter ExbB [Aestuariivita sp.]
MVKWIERLTASDMNPSGNDRSLGASPTLLTPLAAVLRSGGERLQINPVSSRSILDSVAQRIEESRDISRYIVNLLIFLGLLGTFYGLATTIPAVVDIIRNLVPAPGETGSIIFSRLMSGLETQLGGMGVAFASSLLGLAGSLIVGLLELFAGHGQTRFYRELEEWLSSITRLSFAVSEEALQDNSYIPIVLTQLSQQIDALQKGNEQIDINFKNLDERLHSLTSSLETLVSSLEDENQALRILGELSTGQDRITELLTHVNDEELNAETRMRLRSIDVQMLRILEEIASGRQELLSVLHKEIDTALEMFAGNRVGQRLRSDSKKLD